MNDVKKLLTMMEEISERCYCAQWLNGLEYTIWKFVQDDCKTVKWGQSTILRSELNKIRKLANKTGIWWIWIEDKLYNLCDNVMVPIDTWKNHYNKAVRINNSESIKGLKEELGLDE